MAVFPASNLLFHLWAEGVSRYIHIGTKLEGWPCQKVFYSLINEKRELLGLESSTLSQLVKTCPVIINMCDVLSYRSDHLVRPFLGKKWENILKQHEQKGIRIHSKSLAYRRDSCSNDFDLIPKQQKIREVLIMNFIG